MRSFYPSKKIIVIGSVALAFILIIGAIAVTRADKNGFIRNIIAFNNEENLEEPDTDGDGLKDWEEILWGTDENNPDTDGDGTPDGQEIIENRDPTVAGPNDVFNESAEQTLQQRLSAQIDSSNNQTEALAKGIFTQYIELKNQGLDINTISAEELLQRALQTQQDSPTVYTVNDIEIRVLDNQQALLEYMNEFTGLLDDSLPSPENELIILNNAVRNRNKRELAKFDPIIEKYRFILNQSLAIRVPPSVVDMHITMINGYSSALYSIEQMRVALDDPIRALTGIGLYQRSDTVLREGFNKLVTFMSSHDIQHNPETKKYIIQIN